MRRAVRSVLRCAAPLLAAAAAPCRFLTVASAATMDGMTATAPSLRPSTPALASWRRLPPVLLAPQTTSALCTTLRGATTAAHRRRRNRSAAATGKRRGSAVVRRRLVLKVRKTRSGVRRPPALRRKKELKKKKKSAPRGKFGRLVLKVRRAKVWLKVRGSRPAGSSKRRTSRKGVGARRGSNKPKSKAKPTPAGRRLKSRAGHGKQRHGRKSKHTGRKRLRGHQLQKAKYNKRVAAIARLWRAQQKAREQQHVLLLSKH